MIHEDETMKQIKYLKSRNGHMKSSEKENKANI